MKVDFKRKFRFIFHTSASENTGRDWRFPREPDAADWDTFWNLRDVSGISHDGSRAELEQLAAFIPARIARLNAGVFTCAKARRAHGVGAG
jgi:hypothetical protein